MRHLATAVCHVDHGGETQHTTALLVDPPCGLKAVEAGSYFLLRVVNQTQQADLAEPVHQSLIRLLATPGRQGLNRAAPGSAPTPPRA
jgi:hypothetical protein